MVGVVDHMNLRLGMLLGGQCWHGWHGLIQIWDGKRIERVCLWSSGGGVVEVGVSLM